MAPRFPGIFALRAALCALPLALFPWTLLNAQPADDASAACNAPDTPSLSRIDACTRVVEADRSNAQAFANRALARLELGQAFEAIDDYDQALKRKPRETAYLYNRGLAWHRLFYYGRAISDYSAVVRYDPDHIAGYFNRGVVYLDVAQFDNAVQDFTTVLDRDPSFANAHLNRGIAYWMSGSDEPALRDMNVAVSRRPEDPLSFLARGRLHFAAGNFAAAARDLGRAATRSPDDPFVAMWHYVARARAGDVDTTALQRLTETKLAYRWPAQAIHRLLAPTETRQEILAPNAILRRQSLAVLAFFEGQQRLIDGDLAGARRAFEESVDQAMTNLAEHVAAKAELARLR